MVNRLKNVDNKFNWSKENVFAACVLVLGANVSGVANIVSPDIRADSYSSLDAAKDRAYILGMIEKKFDDELSRHVDNEKDIQRLQYRIQECERDLEIL